MKPIKIIMSAFGSYGGREEIDFTGVDRGIFLITGDTGAGKTTIFDAITYALFDETSGGRRDGDMMRSQYAADGMPTFVEYTFSYGKEQYTIRRNPSYRRISKRKNKEGAYTYTTEAAAVELTMPDGMVFPGKNKEINEKIKEILGVDAGQFTQICMIAQGEFLRLLHAPSRERKEIFSRIFDTKIYEQIQYRLREQSKDLYVQLSDNQNILEHELKNVCCPTKELQTEWEHMAKKPESGGEDILACLHRMIQMQQEQEAELQEQERIFSARLDEVKVQAAQAEEINRQFQRKQELETSLCTIENSLEALQQMQTEWGQMQQELERDMEENLPRLEQELASAKALLPKYELLKEKQRDAEKQKKSSDALQQQLSKVKKQEAQLQQEVEELQINCKNLLPVLESLPLVCQQEREAVQRQEELKNLQVQYKQMKQQEAELEDSRKKAAGALDRLEEKSRRYETYNRMFIEEQAGILAEGLEEGCPCPVCGSLHHPQKAELSPKAVSQAQVEAARKKRGQAQEELDELQAVFQKQKEQLEGNRRVFLHNGHRVFGDGFEEEELAKDCNGRLQKALQDCKKDLKQLQKQKNQLEEQQKCHQAWTRQLEELQQKQKQIVEQKEQLQDRGYEEKLAYETAVRSLEELQETLTYDSGEALEEIYQQLCGEKEDLFHRQKTLQERLLVLKQQQAEAEGTCKEQKNQLKLLKTSLEGKESVDSSRLLQKKQELTEYGAALEKQRLKLITEKSSNQRVEMHLKDLYEEREQLVRTYEIAETLSRTANGNLRQQIRLDLQTYVQRRYFKYIVGEANRRLVKMSGGCFMLQCRELADLGRQGEAGLDLDVYDMVTDQIRDVKTLSGGESFLASLSMALGMSDVIQKHAGRVHLETMFIDEGFGSLDEEARGKAMGILQKLAKETGLVGIISHVTELKEQIDRKLVISKNEKGSHASWLMES